MTSKRRSSNAFPVLVAGLALGIGLGLLLAPKSGQEMRESLDGARAHVVETAKQGWDAAVSNGQEWSRQAQHLAGRVKTQVKQVAKAGQRAFEAARG